MVGETTNASHTEILIVPCWVVQRFFARNNRNRRLAKDFQATITSATAFLYAPCDMLLIRRLARSA
jgi:hypothetical protein